MQLSLPTQAVGVDVTPPHPHHPHHPYVSLGCGCRCHTPPHPHPDVGLFLTVWTETSCQSVGRCHIRCREEVLLLGCCLSTSPTLEIQRGFSLGQTEGVQKCMYSHYSQQNKAICCSINTETHCEAFPARPGFHLYFTLFGLTPTASGQLLLIVVLFNVTPLKTTVGHNPHHAGKKKSKHTICQQNVVGDCSILFVK